MPGLLCSLGVFLVHVLAGGAEELSLLGSLCWELAAPCMLGPAVSDETGEGPERKPPGARGRCTRAQQDTVRLLGSSLVATRMSGLQPAGEVGLRAGDVICWEEPCTLLLRAHLVDSLRTLH